MKKNKEKSRKDILIEFREGLSKCNEDVYKYVYTVDL